MTSVKHTHIQLPSDIDDFVILRRVLDNIITHVDKLYGLRGGNYADSEDEVSLGAFSTIDELSEEVNKSLSKLVPLAGTNKISGVLAYSNTINFSNDLDLITKGYVDGKLEKKVTKPTILTQPLSDPPTLVEIQAIQDKINKIINYL